MDRVTRDELLATVRADRARFESVLARVPLDRLTDPMLPGSWSVKDVLAHIAWGEREGLGVLRTRALVGSPLWDVDQDQRNEVVVRESRERGLDSILAEYRGAFAEFVAALDEMSDADLNDPERIAGLPERIPGWRPWRVIYDPEHYEDHAQTIERALRALTPEP